MNFFTVVLMDDIADNKYPRITRAIEEGRGVSDIEPLAAALGDTGFFYISMDDGVMVLRDTKGEMYIREVYEEGRMMTFVDKDGRVEHL